MNIFPPLLHSLSHDVFPTLLHPIIRFWSHELKLGPYFFKLLRTGHSGHSSTHSNANRIPGHTPRLYLWTLILWVQDLNLKSSLQSKFYKLSRSLVTPVEHQRFGKETVPDRTLPFLALPVVFISVKQWSEGCLGTLCRLGVGGLKNYSLLGKQSSFFWFELGLQHPWARIILCLFFKVEGPTHTDFLRILPLPRQQYFLTIWGSSHNGFLSFSLVSHLSFTSVSSHKLFFLPRMFSFFLPLCKSSKTDFSTPQMRSDFPVVCP